jgi:hypothetical protein
MLSLADFLKGPEANGYIRLENGQWGRNVAGQDSSPQWEYWNQNLPTDQQQYRDAAAKTYTADPRYTAFTAAQNAQQDLNSTNPFGPGVGFYNDNPAGVPWQTEGAKWWTGPQMAPKTDQYDAWSGIGPALRDMRGGLSVIGTALGGYLGAAYGGAATGADYGLGEAYGGMASPEAVAGGASVAAPAGGTVGGTMYADASNYANTMTDATAVDGASMPAATAEPWLDITGGYNFDPNTGDVFHGTGDNPFGSNFSGGNTNAFFNGTEAGVDPSMLQQAQDMAKTFGVTPASALTALLKAAGRAAPGVIGAVAANKQADSLQALADKYFSVGAPSRARYEASYAPGFTMANEPGYKDALDLTTKATLHGLSVNGNPAGSPNAWGQTLTDINSKFAFPALQRFREQNANTGGIGTLTAAAPAASSGAIGAQSNVLNALGSSANSIFNPPQSLAEQLAELRRQGLY